MSGNQRWRGKKKITKRTCWTSSACWSLSGHDTARSCPCPEPGVLCKGPQLPLQEVCTPFQLQPAPLQAAGVSPRCTWRTHTPEHSCLIRGTLKECSSRPNFSPIPAAVPGPAGFTQNELFHPFTPHSDSTHQFLYGTSFLPMKRSYLHVSSSRPWAPRVQGRVLFSYITPICHML